MTNETPEQIAKRIINQVCLVPNESACGISSHEKLSSKCCCQLKEEIAQAIREASTVVLPKKRINPIDRASGFNEALEEIKTLNPSKTFKEVE